LDDIETISKTIASKSRAKAKSKSSKTKSSGSSGSDDLEVMYHGYPKRFTADRAVSYTVGLARARQLRNARQGGWFYQPLKAPKHKAELIFVGCNERYNIHFASVACEKHASSLNHPNTTGYLRVLQAPSVVTLEQ
jgi:hypothetical protein